ncbi:OmpH/Skp family outer membrane protein [Ferruginibacter sp.]
MLKKLFLIILLLVSFEAMTAQNKIGVIDIDSLISLMPETAQANLILIKFQDSLTGELGKLEHLQDSITKSWINCHFCYVPDSAKPLRRETMIRIIQQIQNFNQFAQDLTKQKAEDMFKPIKEKAMDAIRKAAQENNYNYILDINSVKFALPADNVLPLVMKVLGIPLNTNTVAPGEKG